MTDKQIYQIGLTMINGVGDILARHLLEALGDAEAVFTEKRQSLEKISGIGDSIIAEIKRFGCANCGIRGAFHRIVRIPTQFRCWRVGKFGHDDAVLSLTGSQSGVDCRVAELAQPFDQCRIGVGITCDAGA